MGLTRRQFLGAAVAAPVLGGCHLPADHKPKVTYATKAVAMGDWHDPSLGRYLRHECVAGPVVYEEMNFGNSGTMRYVNFPVENRLVIHFEHGRCEYRNFNASRASVQSVSLMDQYRLFACRYTEWESARDGVKLLADGFTFMDHYSLFAELNGPESCGMTSTIREEPRMETYKLEWAVSLAANGSTNWAMHK